MRILHTLAARLGVRRHQPAHRLNRGRVIPAHRLIRLRLPDTPIEPAPPRHSAFDHVDDAQITPDVWWNGGRTDL